MKYYFYIIILMSIGNSKESAYVDSSNIRNPDIAWKLGLVPGLGQIYNKKYLKAIGFIFSEYYVINGFNENKDNNINLRNTYAWWILGIYIWNILDSYVDAHLSTYPVKKLQSRVINDTLKVK